MDYQEEPAFHGALIDQQGRADGVARANDYLDRTEKHRVVIYDGDAPLTVWERWLQGEDVALTGTPADLILEKNDEGQGSD